MNTFSYEASSTNYLPLLEGIRVQRGDTGRWVFAVSGQRDSETPRRTPIDRKASDRRNLPSSSLAHTRR